jgi:phospholipid/cholesterol/gamma-HCH transport system permease protein
MQNNKAQLSWEPTAQMLRCEGAWTLSKLGAVDRFIESFAPSADIKKIIINGQSITKFDSGGAWLLERLSEKLTAAGVMVQYQDFSDKAKNMRHLVQDLAPDVQQFKTLRQRLGTLFKIGWQTVHKYQEFLDFLAFIGDLVITLIASIFDPRKIQWRSQMAAIEETGYKAMPIIALLSFLIGVVLTYQMGLQLRIYGANVFIVNLSGMAILREFAPLLTAIIIAGRTSSSFTALIGTMKVNEELDALRTMGLSPTERIVLPRILGLMIALPLLTVWADIFGILGSMFMSKGMLGIGYYDFLTRFAKVIEVKTYLIGLSKAPVFAVLIATVGCFQGFQVAMSADSVGRQTTKSVVQAIFLIIIADALFSIVFSIQGI